jgi:SPP1 gp7 family putative phage head morphogenesis protein
MGASVADRIAVDLVRNQVDIARYAETVKLYVTQLLGELQDSIVGRLAGKDPTMPVRTAYQQARLEQILAEVKGIIDDGYKGIKNETDSSLYDFARVQQASVLGSVNNMLGTELMTHALTNEQLKQIASDTMINGAKSGQWWNDQQEEMKFAFEREMRQGMLQGETLGELIQRVRGKRAWKDQPGREAVSGFFDKSYAQAEALVRTSVMAVANQTHLDVYNANLDVISQIQWLSTLDLRTTPICQGLDSKTWDAKTYAPIGHSFPFPGPTAHWNCRSTQIPVTKSWEELATQNKALAKQMDALPESTRASMDGQVAQKMTYEEFLQKLPEKQQMEVLGSKYDLWAKTKELAVSDPARITLADMLDQKGNPLSLTEFADKAGYKLDHPDEIRAHIARLEEEARRISAEQQRLLEEHTRMELEKQRIAEMQRLKEEELKAKVKSPVIDIPQIKQFTKSEMDQMTLEEMRSSNWKQLADISRVLNDEYYAAYKMKDPIEAARALELVVKKAEGIVSQYGTYSDYLKKIGKGYSENIINYQRTVANAKSEMLKMAKDFAVTRDKIITQANKLLAEQGLPLFNAPMTPKQIKDLEVLRKATPGLVEKLPDDLVLKYGRRYDDATRAAGLASDIKDDISMIRRTIANTQANIANFSGYSREYNVALLERQEALLAKYDSIAANPENWLSRFAWESRVEFITSEDIKNDLMIRSGKEMTKLINAFAKKFDGLGFDKRFFSTNFVDISYANTPAHVGGYYKSDYKAIEISKGYAAKTSIGMQVDNVLVHEFGHHLDLTVLEDSRVFDQTKVWQQKKIVNAAFVEEQKKVKDIYDWTSKGYTGSAADIFNPQRDQIKNALVASRSNAPSAYSLMNRREFFAECFEQYINKPDTLKRKLPAVFDAFEKLFKSDMFV